MATIALVLGVDAVEGTIVGLRPDGALYPVGSIDHGDGHTSSWLDVGEEVGMLDSTYPAGTRLILGSDGYLTELASAPRPGVNTEAFPPLSDQPPLTGNAGYDALTRKQEDLKRTIRMNDAAAQEKDAAAVEFRERRDQAVTELAQVEHVLNLLAAFESLAVPQRIVLGFDGSTSDDAVTEWKLGPLMASPSRPRTTAPTIYQPREPHDGGAAPTGR